MTERVCQSNRIASKRKTNVIAIPMIAAGRTGTCRKAAESMNVLTPSSEAMT